MSSVFRGKNKIVVILLISVLYLLFNHFTNQSPEKIKGSKTLENPGIEQSTQQSFTVTKVIDGDTIALESGQTIRLIGIDTPETVDPRKGVQCFGKEASNKTKELLLGASVTLEKDVSETDRYGRLLRYVYKDSVLINELLVKEGYAHASAYPPDVKYQELLDKAEKEAREKNRGLWGTCTLETVEPSPQPNVKFTCDCTKNCSELSSCQEAQFQLKDCNCTARDGDNDGIACSGKPLYCK